jgi:ankyrin repeat protein
VVQLLLEKGAAVDAEDTYLRTALYYAASDRHEAVVRLLLEKGAAVDTEDGGETNSAP